MSMNNIPDYRVLHFCLLVIIAASAGCHHVARGSDAAVTIEFSRGLSAGEYWSPRITPVSAPGSTYHIGVSGRFAAPRDILVDFLDRTGWYAGSRITVPAGDFFEQSVAITLPATVRDPQSVFFSVKVLPVGESWQHYLDVNNTKVTWLEPRRIETPLFFPGDVDAWDYVFSRNYSNHDGWRVHVGVSPDGPFNGAETISAYHFGMTGDSDDFQLNLETGEIYFLQTPPAYPGLSPIEKRHAFPRAEEEKVEWLNLLNELINSVDYVLDSKGQGSQPFLEYPSLKNTSNYLHRLMDAHMVDLCIN